ncbi:hypothetical protein AKJ16_DCAP02075 [Drosera capensis]
MLRWKIAILACNVLRFSFGLSGAGDARPVAVSPVAACRLAAGPGAGSGAAGLDVTGQVGAGQDAAEQVEGVQDAAGQRAAEPHRFRLDDLSFATANFSKYNGRGAYGDVYLGDLEDQIVAGRILPDEPHPEEEFTEDVPFLKNGSWADLLHDIISL